MKKKKKKKNSWLGIATVVAFTPIFTALTAWAMWMYFEMDDTFIKKLVHYGVIWMIWSGAVIIFLYNHKENKR